MAHLAIILAAYKRDRDYKSKPRGNTPDPDCMQIWRMPHSTHPAHARPRTRTQIDKKYFAAFALTMTAYGAGTAAAAGSCLGRTAECPAGQLLSRPFPDLMRPNTAQAAHTAAARPAPSRRHQRVGPQVHVGRPSRGYQLALASGSGITCIYMIWRCPIASNDMYCGQRIHPRHAGV